MDIPDLGGKVGGVGTALLVAAAIMGLPLLVKANRAIVAERKAAKLGGRRVIDSEADKVLRKKQRDQCIREGKL